MKTLVNKRNPAIRITAPEIEFYRESNRKFYVLPNADFHRLFKMENWTLVEEEQKPIFEVFGFKVGDAVRLKDGDGRKHIIKSFEEIEGIHGPNFYQVEFEDNSARDGIYPGEEYPNGYYTQMEKFKKEPVDLEKFTEKIKTFQRKYKHPEIVSIKGAMAFMARMFYQYPDVARLWYEQLPKTTMD